MKKILAIAMLLAALHMPAQDTLNGGKGKLPLQEELAFKVGEKLRYKVRYGLLNAGKMELEVKSKTTAQSQEILHIAGRGWSVGMTEWFFKVRDRYETYLDVHTLAPTEFIRDVSEGGYDINRHLIFDQEEGTAIDLKAKEKGSFEVPIGVQDVFSTLYYARNIDMSGIEMGDVIAVDMFLDHKLYPFQLKYIGEDQLKTDMGKVRCKMFIPRLQEGRIFKDQEGMTIWVTDDKNHLPVLLKTDLLIGSLKAEMTEYENIKFPINFVN